MVRTRADNCAASRKVVAASAPRKSLGGGSSSSASADSPSGKNAKYAGGNPVCARPTPDWQKEISTFFVKSPCKGKENSSPESDSSGSSQGSSSSGQSSSSKDDE